MTLITGVSEKVPEEAWEVRVRKGEASRTHKAYVCSDSERSAVSGKGGKKGREEELRMEGRGEEEERESLMNSYCYEIE